MHVFVCGCAPELTAEDGRTSAPASNASVFVGLNGVPATSTNAETGTALGTPLTGFAGATGFTWQSQSTDPAAPTPVTVTVTDTESNQLNLWMADDSLIISAIKLVPVETLAAEGTVSGAACLPDQTPAP